MRLPTSILSFRRRAVPLALGVVALTASACSTGSTTTGRVIAGFNSFGTSSEDGPGTYGVGAHATLALKASGKGSLVTDYAGVSWNWQLRWKDGCGSAFSAVPEREQGYGYSAVAGDAPVHGSSGTMQYTRGTSVVIAVRAPASCAWTVEATNLWTGGPSHS